MASTGNKDKTKTGKDTGQGSSSQQPKSALTQGLTTAAHGLTKAVTSSARSAASSTPSTGSDDPPDPPIVEALKKKLPPDFPCGDGSNFTDPRFFTINEASGKSTEAAVAPMAWIEEDKEAFLKTYFTDELAKISVPYRTPQLERSFIMSNEADVVRASALYLVNVVNIAAQAWLGDKYVLKCIAENHSAEKIGAVTYATKTDIAWALETPAEPKKPLPVAVMEYKRKHMIDPKLLLNAKYIKGQDASKMTLKAKKVGDTETCFTDTALWLVKQVKSYQQRRKLMDVCLFDWDTLFILNFGDGFDPAAPQRAPAPKTDDADIDRLWPAGILYQEQANPSAEYTFRSLLLAFLIRALKRVTEPSGPPPPASGGGGGGDGGVNVTRPLPTRPKPGQQGNTSQPKQGQGSTSQPKLKPGNPSQPQQGSTSQPKPGQGNPSQPKPGQGSTSLPKPGQGSTSQPGKGSHSQPKKQV